MAAGEGWQGRAARAQGWAAAQQPTGPRTAGRLPPQPASTLPPPPTLPLPLLPPPPRCRLIVPGWLGSGGRAALQLGRAGQGWRRPAARRPSARPRAPPHPATTQPHPAFHHSCQPLHRARVGRGMARQPSAWHGPGAAGGATRRRPAAAPPRPPEPRPGCPALPALPCPLPACPQPCPAWGQQGGRGAGLFWGGGGLLGAGCGRVGWWGPLPPARPSGGKCWAGLWVGQLRTAGYEAGLQPSRGRALCRQFVSGAGGPRSSRGEVKQLSRRLPAAAALQSLPSDRPIDSPVDEPSS